MSYSVALLNFEGPLDLLLQLIERSELSITEISLGSVTEQYLTYIGQIKALDAQELNQFIELAAKLIHIKSLALLPQTETETEEENLYELSQQLERYRHYQKATAYLDTLLRKGDRSWSREIRPQLPIEKLPPPEIDLEALERVFQSSLERLPITDEATLESNVTLEEMMERIMLYAKQTVPARLSYLLKTVTSRMEALVLFLAVLELIKAGSISARQHSQFDDIILTNE